MKKMFLATEGNSSIVSGISQPVPSSQGFSKACRRSFFLSITRQERGSLALRRLQLQPQVSFQVQKKHTRHSISEIQTKHICFKKKKVVQQFYMTFENEAVSCWHSSAPIEDPELMLKDYKKND